MHVGVIAVAIHAVRTRIDDRHRTRQRQRCGHVAILGQLGERLVEALGEGLHAVFLRLPKLEPEVLLERLVGLFARLDRPIDFESLDGQPVDLIFLLLAPETAGAEYVEYWESGEVLDALKAVEPHSYVLPEDVEKFKQVLPSVRHEVVAGAGFDLFLIETEHSPTDIEVVLPVHPNPNVKETVEAVLCDAPSVHLIPPVDYLEFVHLMARAHLILTDSGGVQEEAPSLGKPVLVLRDTTERPEGVDAGTLRLVGTGRDLLERDEVKSAYLEGGRPAASNSWADGTGDSANRPSPNSPPEPIAIWPWTDWKPAP